jgi:ligand-binding sensor domain-containing protein
MRSDRFYGMENGMQKIFKLIILLCILMHSDLSGLYAHDHQGNLYFDRILTENIKIERGISNNNVKTILQDNQGFFWFGTLDGLNRFDGYSFTVYNKDHGLSNESIHDLVQSGDSLWIATEFGLNFLNLKTGQIGTAFYQTDKNSVSDNWINDLYIDQKGRIWVCSASGLDLYDFSTKKFRQIRAAENKYKLFDLQYNAIVQDGMGNFYIGTDHGLFVLDAESGEIERFMDEGKLTGLPSNQVNCLLKGKNNTVYVGTKKGLLSFDPVNGKFSRLKILNPEVCSLAKDEILCLEHDPDHGLWIGTFESGLIYYDDSTTTVELFKSNSSQIFSLSNNRVLTLYKDANGILWIGTFNGLNKIDRNAPKFRSFRISNDLISGISQNQVWCFEEYKAGQILVGTDNGLGFYDKEKGILSEPVTNGNLFKVLKNKQIRTLFLDSENHLWAGTRHDGLYLFDENQRLIRTFLHDPADPTSISNNYILDILEDHDGNIWITTSLGLNKFDKSSKLFVKYFHNETAGSLPDNKVYDLFIDKKGTIWIATAEGLAKFNPVNESFDRFAIPYEQMHKLHKGSNVFFSVTGDEDVFWLGTRGGGLLKLNKADTSFSVLTMEDGLTDNYIYMVLEDAWGRLWITTNWGLSQYDQMRNSFINFDISDGLQGNEFNWNSGLIDSEGEFFIGGLNGFNVFYPKEITQKSGTQKLRITEFRKFNIIQNQLVEDGDTIRLKYNDNFFSFTFSALDFNNPAKSKYRFMLEGYDSKWIERNANQRIAEYTQVPPGIYHFRLKSSSTNGEWNGKVLSVFIIIDPPWYSTWYFRFSVFGLLVLLVYSIFHFRIRYVRKKHTAEKQIFEFEKQLYQLEQKALQLQMNPHFLFNSLNSIQGLILSNDINGAIRYLSKFSHLMRQTLNNSSESLIPLRNELNALNLYLEIESFRFGDRFDFSLEIDPAIDEDFTEVPPMILQPYVENAIVHGLLNSKHKGHLLIKLFLEGENLHCTIQDDGIGRKRAIEIRQESGIERKSVGMSITGERLSILNQFTNEAYKVQVSDLYDENGNASGTRVDIDIHVGQ